MKNLTAEKIECRKELRKYKPRDEACQFLTWLPGTNLNDEGRENQLQRLSLPLMVVILIFSRRWGPEAWGRNGFGSNFGESHAVKLH